MTTQSTDPLAEAEKIVQEMHEATHRQLHPVHRKYPLLFLFLVTFSVAAVFHGLDLVIDQIPFFSQHPFVLVLVGIIGLFLAGALYKRLGKDKYE